MGGAPRKPFTKRTEMQVILRTRNGVIGTFNTVTEAKRAAKERDNGRTAPWKKEVFRLIADGPWHTRYSNDSGYVIEDAGAEDPIH